MEVECKVSSSRDDGTTVSMAVPMFDPHDILRHLFRSGMKIPTESLKRYWRHLKSVNDRWALSVNDETLIPSLVDSSYHVFLSFGQEFQIAESNTEFFVVLKLYIHP